MLFSIHPPLPLLWTPYPIHMPWKAGLTPFISHQDRTASMKCVTVPFTTPMQVPPKQCRILKTERPHPRGFQPRISVFESTWQNKRMHVITRKLSVQIGGKACIKRHKMSQVAIYSFIRACIIYWGRRLLQALKMRRQILSNATLRSPQSCGRDRHKNRPGQDSMRSPRRKVSMGGVIGSEVRHSTKTTRWNKTCVIQLRTY